MLELVDFPNDDRLRTMSPFTYKAEALLAMAHLDYVKIPATPELMPQGKVPVLRDAGALIPDSSLIQRHLETRHGLAADRDLDAMERAVAEAFRRMTEEHLRNVLVYMRWTDPALEEAMLTNVFSQVPEPQRRAVFEDVRGQVAATLNAQGISRHSREDVYRFGCDDLDAIATWLGDKPFFMGERPTSVDATIVGVLYQLFSLDAETPLTRHARSIPTLPAYVIRFEHAVFGPKAKLPAPLAALGDMAA